jgi:magnesium-protoporphyrin O-methyltransferase
VAVRRVAQHLETSATGGRIDFRSGDCTDPALGEFDHVVAMDSLIHYNAADAVRVLQGWSSAPAARMVFTFAPSTRCWLAMHAVGRLFPRGDRAPWIEPVAEARCAACCAPTRPARLARPHAARVQRLLHLAGFWSWNAPMNR